MLSNASLRKVSYNIIIHKIRIKKIFKNIEKNDAKTLIKINNYIYSKVIIDKIE